MNLLTFPPLRRRVIGAIEKRPVLFLIFVALYILSPVDLMPESVFGPLGAFDDVLVGLMGWAVLKGLWRRRKAARDERKRIEAKRDAWQTGSDVSPARRTHVRTDYRRGSPPTRQRRERSSPRPR